MRFIALWSAKSMPHASVKRRMWSSVTLSHDERDAMKRTVSMSRPDAAAISSQRSGVLRSFLASSLTTGGGNLRARSQNVTLVLTKE